MNPLQSTREEMRELVVSIRAGDNSIYHLYDRLVDIIDNAAPYNGMSGLVFIAKQLYREAADLENAAHRIRVLAECARDRLKYLDHDIDD
jgi:hypothetical protein